MPIPLMSVSRHPSNTSHSSDRANIIQSYVQQVLTSHIAHSTP